MYRKKIKEIEGFVISVINKDIGMLIDLKENIHNYDSSIKTSVSHTLAQASNEHSRTKRI